MLDAPTRLRAYLGERIPEEGVDTDTIFTDDEIQELIILFQGPFAGMPEGLYLSAAEGWERKASYYADQVDHQQGGAVDTLSQLNKNSISQADRYRSLAYNRSQPRVGKIVRPGSTVI